MRRIGRATIAAALIFIASLAVWILQRPEDTKNNSIPWPDVSWVIVTTTSTTTIAKQNTPKKTTTPPPVEIVAPNTTTAGTETTLPPTQTTVAVEIPLETSTTAAG